MPRIETPSPETTRTSEEPETGVEAPGIALHPRKEPPPGLKLAPAPEAKPAADAGGVRYRLSFACGSSAPDEPASGSTT